LGFGPKLVIAQAFEASLQGIDAIDRFAVLLEQPIVAAAEYFGKEWDGHVNLIHPQRSCRQ
jgi:hypothetical protein